jgi:hypothetical protein
VELDDSSSARAAVAVAAVLGLDVLGRPDLERRTASLDPVAQRTPCVAALVGEVDLGSRLQDDVSARAAAARAADVVEEVGVLSRAPDAPVGPDLARGPEDDPPPPGPPFSSLEKFQLGVGKVLAGSALPPPPPP